MMDLLGSDLPVEGGRGGDFTWSDGVFLQAIILFSAPFLFYFEPKQFFPLLV